MAAGITFGNLQLNRFLGVKSQRPDGTLGRVDVFLTGRGDGHEVYDLTMMNFKRYARPMGQVEHLVQMVR